MSEYENKGDAIIFGWLERYQKPAVIFIASIILFFFARDAYERNLCETVCLANCFVSFRFVPRGRIHSYTCKCLTEDEAREIKIIPKGTTFEIYSS